MILRSSQVTVGLWQRSRLLIFGEASRGSQGVLSVRSSTDRLVLGSSLRWCASASPQSATFGEILHVVLVCLPSPSSAHPSFFCASWPRCAGGFGPTSCSIVLTIVWCNSWHVSCDCIVSCFLIVTLRCALSIFLLILIFRSDVIITSSVQRYKLSDSSKRLLRVWPSGVLPCLAVVQFGVLARQATQVSWFFCLVLILILISSVLLVIALLFTFYTHYATLKTNQFYTEPQTNQI